ncbi:MAG: nucleotidyl transferase AbiEii/AbiGii toxin family protein [Syntrophobacterales bacterium]|nr:nucleotidyl transferase AbiEii/AbiGii toxin family protein [Syntrophobacterales bacterium]
MPTLSEFVASVSEKSGVKNLELIEKDIVLHKILREICSSAIRQDYLFKGGSCLVKCYFGYYRFSVDLDFTWKVQEVWEGLRKRRLRSDLLNKITDFGFVLEKVCGEIGLDFKTKLEDKRFLELGGRMVTFKLWKGSEFVKIQVNYIEKILFNPKNIIVKTILDFEVLQDPHHKAVKE